MNSWVRILILFAFVIAPIGQSFAFESITCDMSMADKPAHSMSMSADYESIDHNDMDHSDMDQTMDMDCCGAECQCPQSACTSFSYLANQQSLQTFNSISEKIVASAFTLIHTDINSLFRPPILA